MEFPAGLTAIERGLAAVLLAAVAALGWLESRSPLSAAVREGRPWSCWLTIKGGPGEGAPRLYLGVYQPARRTLDLVYFPERSRGRARTLAEAYAQVSAHFQHDGGPAGGAPEPALAGKEWLVRRTRGPGLWTPRAREASDLSPFDELLLAAELRKLPPQSIRPAWLPEEEQQKALFERLLSTAAAPGPGEGRAISVEVLNASSRKGIAGQATKILRSKGADVVNFGNLAAAQPRTVVYDRLGRIENAAAVVGMLGCPTAEAVTQVNTKRLVDVTVILAEDCQR